MEIPVYLFTGFLESGKTTFIQEALEDKEFNNGERTLFLLCEEGEEEYHPARFYGLNVFFERIDEESQLKEEYLDELLKKHNAERVVVEYNGMWNLDSFYQNMPQEWLGYQEMLFFDANTFLTYNQAMRPLVYDKLKSAELVVFNRCTKGFDKMEFHQVVRGANRNSEIVYEYEKDDIEYDTIEDPLPFDIDAPVVEVPDNCFAEWYRDINEEPEKYDRKVIKVKGRASLGGELPENIFAFGRHVMTCCVDDIQYAALAYVWDKVDELKQGEWYEVTAESRYEYHDIYGEEGPVLYVKEVLPALPADPEVATF